MATWTSKQSAAQFASATGKTLARYMNIRYSPVAAGLIFVQALTIDLYVYVGCSQDGGATWIWKQVGLSNSLGAETDTFGFAVDNYNKDIVYTARKSGELMKSVDATSATPTYSIAYQDVLHSPTTPLANIHVPTEDNRNGSIVYIGSAGGFEIPAARYDSNDGWLGISGMNGTIIYHAGVVKVNRWCTVGDDVTIWDGVFTTPYGENTDAGIEFTTFGSVATPVVIDLGVVQPPDSTITIFTTGNESASWGGWIAFSEDNVTWTGYSSLNFTKCSPPVGSTFSIAGYRYIRGFNGSGDRATDFYYGYVTNGLKAGGGPYIEISIDGGNTFTEINPEDVYGSFLSKNIITDNTNRQKIFALAGSSVLAENLYSSVDAGLTWSTLATDLTTPKSIGVLDSDSIYLLQGNAINLSNDNGVTLLNKNGNWSSVMGSAFANPRAMLPVYSGKNISASGVTA